MSVVFSKLKASKPIVLAFLRDKYKEDNFDCFYSLGTEEQEFRDQFLKIETDISPSYFNGIKSNVGKFLTAVDITYAGLDIKVVEKR